ncbi:hypothetical protein IWW55_000178 [Coemansia sp. RSA 2706]|nr:hypothetical protein LPJ63_005023 [Coemansia sp. RSA 2711]KAJ2308863.1 hypothetical protein IWW55_000178 [Coemansia sp. RSA 2706]KAJ2322085.1 hypothetical protein IWW52_000323 [Coemansia sp. RSA 2704]KAJ2330088.1 hypothetical protein IWW51_000177 [Coemansia sp. RSA 2702]KAJ2369460.1 hypothetical protein H4S01_000990 [Coemansia sp. RSA 2610]KAJ2392191.1 hypothetical protein H4S02_000924 [Coemansia sp. RSA 2611]
MAAPPKQNKQGLKLDLDTIPTRPVVQPAAWVPNPSTSKLASAFARTKPAVSAIYCSQCRRFYDDPGAFSAHIPTCD